MSKYLVVFIDTPFQHEWFEYEKVGCYLKHSAMGSKFCKHRRGVFERHNMAPSQIYTDAPHFLVIITVNNHEPLLKMVECIMPHISTRAMFVFCLWIWLPLLSICSITNLRLIIGNNARNATAVYCVRPWKCQQLKCLHWDTNGIEINERMQYVTFTIIISL